MRFDQRFCARTAVTAGLFAAAVSVFGLSPVHAQTTPAVPPAAQPAVVRMNADDAVATALEQNLDLQVQRINPQIRDLDTAVFKANYTPNFTTNIDFVDQTQPPSSLLVRQHQPAHQRPQRLQLRHPAGDAVVRRAVSGAVQQRPHHDEQHLHELRSAADVEHQRHLHAAAAAQLQDRRHAPAAAGQPEELGNLADAAEAVDHADDPHRPQRVLRPAVCDRQPERAAAVAGTVAAVAQGQSRPRRDRHHGAARHRPGRGRSGDARGSGDRRRGGDRAAAGSAPRADFRAQGARDVEHAHRAERNVRVCADAGRYRCRGEERAQPAHRPRGRAQEPRVERHLDQVLRQPVAAGPERVDQLRPPGDRRRRIPARSESGSRARSSARSRGATGRRWARCLAATSRRGRSRST